MELREKGDYTALVGDTVTVNQQQQPKNQQLELKHHVQCIFSCMLLQGKLLKYPSLSHPPEDAWRDYDILPSFTNLNVTNTTVDQIEQCMQGATGPCKDWLHGMERLDFICFRTGSYEIKEAMAKLKYNGK
eukprot:1829045-Ditylum_brightwellii.AAC.2